MPQLEINVRHAEECGEATKRIRELTSTVGPLLLRKLYEASVPEYAARAIDQPPFGEFCQILMASDGETEEAATMVRLLARLEAHEQWFDEEQERRLAFENKVRLAIGWVE